MNIYISGSLAFDRIMDFPGYFQEHILPDKIHSLNVSFNVEKLKEKKGGTAGNIAYSLSLLNEYPNIVASVGNDFSSYLSYLKKLKLATKYIKVFKDITTACAYIITDLDDNQITGFYMGAMANRTHIDLKKSDPKNTIVILSPGNKKDMIQYSAECRKSGIKYIFDPGQTLPFLTPNEIKRIIKGSYILISNDYELQMIIKRTNLSENDIFKMSKIIITTLGKKGSVIRTSNKNIFIKSCKAKKIVDPTGAGDAYRAGILKGLAVNLGLEQLGRIASVAAVYAVENYGTQEHKFTFAEFKKRYQATFLENCPI